MDVAKMYDEVSERYQKLIEGRQYVGTRWIDGKLKTLNLQQASALDLACATGSIGEVIKTHYRKCPTPSGDRRSCRACR